MRLAEIAQVVVEGPPGLVVYLLDRELLAVGKLDQGVRACAENVATARSAGTIRSAGTACSCRHAS